MEGICEVSKNLSPEFEKLVNEKLKSLKFSWNMKEIKKQLESNLVYF